MQKKKTHQEHQIWGSTAPICAWSPTRLVIRHIPLSRETRLHRAIVGAIKHGMCICSHRARAVDACNTGLYAYVWRSIRWLEPVDRVDQSLYHIQMRKRVSKRLVLTKSALIGASKGL